MTSIRESVVAAREPTRRTQTGSVMIIITRIHLVAAVVLELDGMSTKGHRVGKSDAAAIVEEV